MGPALMLPRLVFGDGALAQLPAELALLGVRRPLLISDRGLERAGLVDQLRAAAPGLAAEYLDTPENPTAAAADAATVVFKAHRCDGVVALGGGSVLDTAKFVAALSGISARAAELIGQPELIGEVAPLIAIPTTVGTGSESSPVAALHVTQHGPAIGTRGPKMVVRVALCDPALTRTLPPRLIAATAIDALSHCIEGYFAEPANPAIDALALDGAGRVMADVHEAMSPAGDAARASLMAAAFAGGAAIHKGLGPAHAVALVCGDQPVHHGTLVGIALPHTTRLLASALPAKAARLRAAMGLEVHDDIGDKLAELIASLGLPLSLGGADYRLGDHAVAAAAMAASPFNRTSPYSPSVAEYEAIVGAIA